MRVRITQQRCRRTWSLAAGLAVVAAASLAAQGPDRQLVDAVQRHDGNAIRTLLASGADVNRPSADGTTPLHWAVHHDDTALVATLLKAGAVATAANRYGVNPLSIAALNGNATIVAALLEAGVSPATAMAEGETALMTAARSGSLETVRVLISRGADVNARDGWRGQTALMWAAAEGHAAVVGELLAHKADVAVRAAPPNKNPRARTPAAATGPQQGYTAVMFAARGGHIDAVNALLDAGANVNDRAPSGVTLLHLSIINAHFELAAQLLERGADPNATVGLGVTPLHQLIQVRRPVYATRPAPIPTGNLDSLDLLRLLLARGAKVDAGLLPPKVRRPAGEDTVPAPGGGATPFWLAARGPDVEAMRVLLEAGANPLATTDDGVTALMTAAGIGFRQGTRPKLEPEVLAAVTLAVERGGDVNATDAEGYTALHGAAFRGVNAVVLYLLERGARIDAKTKDGRTPLDIANDATDARSQPETAALLRALVAKSAARQ
jgi:ankyrin repeat protein